MDPVAGDLTVPASQHPYAYGLNNPLRYTDPTGRMPVWALRFLSALYNADMLGAGATSLLTLIVNGPGAVRTAIHEIAQLNAAKRLHDIGLEPILEYACGGLEADIVSVANRYAWEVKRLGTDAQTQLATYLQLGNLKKGPTLDDPVEDIPTFGDFKMRVAFDEPGGIHYSLYSRNTEGVRVPVFIPEVEEEYKRNESRLTARATTAAAAFAIILAGSAVEDLFTGGGGAADDAASVVVAVKVAELILAAP